MNSSGAVMLWQSSMLLLVWMLLLFINPIYAGDRKDFSAWNSDKGFFPILPWDTPGGWICPSGDQKAGIEGIAACKFSISAFARPEDLPLIEKLGLKVIVAGPKDQGPWKKKWIDVSDEEIDSAIKGLVEKAGNSPAVMGYYITDEPGTPKFKALAKAVRAVEKYAPGKLAYINLYPGYATIGDPDKSQLGAQSFTEYLERYVTEVKPHMLSYDDYQIMVSDNQQNKDRTAIYYTDLLEVRRVTQKHGIPFWNTVCSNRIRPFTTVPSPANLLLQAYTTLAAGGRGIAWFTYLQHGYAYAPVSKSGDRTDTWHYLQMVNRQVSVLGPVMNRMESTGVFFTDPAPAKEMPVLPGRLVSRVESCTSLKEYSKDCPSVMVGEFEGEDGCDYVMLVNLSLEKSANYKIHTQKTYSAKEVISAADGKSSPLDETNGHWCVPGQGVLIRLVAK